MANELIRPIDADTAHAVEEAAKAMSKAIEAAMRTGKYFGAVLGDLPHDLVGIIGDWVAHQRARRWIELQRETDKILRDRGVENREEVSPSVAIPLIAAAINEDREVLKQMWAKLLAAAMDPDRASLVRPSLIELLRQLDPLDAQILQQLVTSRPPETPGLDFAEAFSQIFGASRDEAFLSLERLHELGCLSASPSLLPRPNGRVEGSSPDPRGLRLAERLRPCLHLAAFGREDLSLVHAEGAHMRDKRFPGFPYAAVGKFLMWTVIVVVGLVVVLSLPAGGLLGGHVSNTVLAFGILAILGFLIGNQGRNSG